MFSKSKVAYSVSLLALVGSLAACGGGTTTTTTGQEPAAEGSNLTGTLTIDGSSTVFPISEAFAEEFQALNPNVQITVGASGTGGGFQKFCNGETQVSGASRPIKPEEFELCTSNGIEMIEIPVATDALTVAVNPANDWATCMTVEELNTAWGPEAEGTITNWNQINPAYPDAPLVLYGAGTDSGTFDYFTEVINGEAGASRGDYTASEDDNVLVQGVSGDVNALGFFGYAYFFENQDRMKAVEIDAGNGCVAPNEEDVLNGTYTPLSRPLFIYVNKAELESNEAFQSFVQFVLDPANRELVSETGYVALSDEQYAAAKADVDAGVVKTVE